MVAMRDEPLETQLDAFDWFGSYMLEEAVGENSEEQVVQLTNLLIHLLTNQLTNNQTVNQLTN